MVIKHCHQLPKPTPGPRCFQDPNPNRTWSTEKLISEIDPHSLRPLATCHRGKGGGLRWWWRPRLCTMGDMWDRSNASSSMALEAPRTWHPVHVMNHLGIAYKSGPIIRSLGNGRPRTRGTLNRRRWLLTCHDHIQLHHLLQLHQCLRWKFNYERKVWRALQET
jgi:hypothetical protein